MKHLVIPTSALVNGYPNLVWLLLASLLMLVPGHLSLQAQTAPQPAGRPLRSYVSTADDPLIYVGGILRTNFQSMTDTNPYEQVAAREFNFFSPENAMKMKYIQPSEGAFSFTNADTAVQFAESHNANFHGHVLVGGHRTYLPDWVFAKTQDATTMTGVMNSEIDTLVNRWSPSSGEPVQLWEVINESFAPSPHSPVSTDWKQGLRYGQPLTIIPVVNSCNSSTAPIPNTAYDVFLNTIGPAYIENAFRRAHADNPSAKLIYNDSVSGTTTNQLSYIYEMAQDFTNPSRSNGLVPIDGFGFQAHQNGDQTLTQREQVLTNFNKFAALGLNIYITELDWGAEGSSDSVTNNDILDRQARRYYDYLDMALRSPGLKGVQVWGITDEYTYRKSSDPCSGTPDPQPLLFDKNYTAKPSYYAVQDGLSFQSRAETLTNGGFEAGSVSPWVTRNGGILALVATGTGHWSNNAVKISERTVVNSGPSQDVTSKILADGAGRYYIRGWAKVQIGTLPMKLTLRLVDGSGTTFHSTPAATVGTTWTQISGWLPVTWNKTLSSATLYAENNGTSITDFYLDDVTLSDGNLISNNSFESGLTGGHLTTAAR